MHRLLTGIAVLALAGTALAQRPPWAPDDRPTMPYVVALAYYEPEQTMPPWLTSLQRGQREIEEMEAARHAETMIEIRHLEARGIIENNVIHFERMPELVDVGKNRFLECPVWPRAGPLWWGRAGPEFWLGTGINECSVSGEEAP